MVYFKNYLKSKHITHIVLISSECQAASLELLCRTFPIAKWQEVNKISHTVCHFLYEFCENLHMWLPWQRGWQHSSKWKTLEKKSMKVQLVSLEKFKCAISTRYAARAKAIPNFTQESNAVSLSPPPSRMSEKLSTFHSLSRFVLKFPLTTLDELSHKPSDARYAATCEASEWNSSDPLNVTLHTVLCESHTQPLNISVGSWLWFYSCSGYQMNRTYYTFPSFIRTHTKRNDFPISHLVPSSKNSMGSKSWSCMDFAEYPKPFNQSIKTNFATNKIKNLLLNPIRVHFCGISRRSSNIIFTSKKPDNYRINRCQ